LRQRFKGLECCTSAVENNHLTIAAVTTIGYSTTASFSSTTAATTGNAKGTATI
jgi:hypothetical protein